MILDSPPFGTETDMWREYSKMRDEMSRLLSLSRRSAGGTFPAINVWADQESAVVMAELPGVSQEDLEISVVGDTLTLKGVRKPQESDEKMSFHRRERGSGRFARTMQLPFRVERDAVSATMRNGILSINLPRAEADKPKKIQIQVGQ